MRLALLVAAALLAASSAPPQARAADTVVAHDTLIDGIWALNGDLVYSRRGTTVPERAWMARYRGHMRRAHGIPRTAGAEGMGLDAKGREVFVFATGSRGSVKWFVYDLARNRSRRLSTPATRCPIGWLSVWRHTMAHTTSCKDPSKNALLLKRGGHTRPLPPD